MASLAIRAARIILSVLAVVSSGAAFGYPAVLPWKQLLVQCGATTIPASDFVYATAAEACSSRSAAQNNLAAKAYMGDCVSNYIGTYVSTSGNACNIRITYNGNQQYASVPGGSVQQSAVLSCPGGGTLSGSTCTCPAGYTDTGSGCTAPSCPADQFYNGTACVSKCPASGSAWAVGDHPNNSWSGGIAFSNGSKYACEPSWYGTSPQGTASCQVEPSGMVMVCDGATCYSELARYTGKACGSTSPEVPTTPTPVDPTPTTCEAGDVWCLSSNGTCGAGFTAGTINDKTICAKIGQPVTVRPQPESPNAPPLAGGQPNSWTNPSARPGESINPSTRLVVSIGSAGTTFPGTGSGGGEEQGDCGYGAFPPCKIDETGTPNGTGAFTGADGKLTEATDAIKGLGSEATKTDGKDTSWKIGFLAPTGCTNPPTLTLPAGITFTADMCRWQPEISAAFSFLWYLLTLSSCLAMIRSTMTGGAV